MLNNQKENRQNNTASCGTRNNGISTKETKQAVHYKDETERTCREFEVGIDEKKLLLQSAHGDCSNIKVRQRSEDAERPIGNSQEAGKNFSRASDAVGNVYLGAHPSLLSCESQR